MADPLQRRRCIANAQERYPLSGPALSLALRQKSLDNLYTNMTTYPMLARQTILPRYPPKQTTPLLPCSCSLLALFFAPLFIISNLQPLFPKHPGWGYLAASSMRVEARVLLCLRFLLLLCFHNLTNCFPATPFFSQPSEMPRGVEALFRRGSNRNAKSARPLSPFNAVFRHSMQGNTV